MIRYRLLAALVVMALLPGCIPVSPLMPLLSATARVLFNNRAEQKHAGPISVDQLLARTQDTVVARVPSEDDQMHLVMSAARPNDTQKTRMAGFAANLAAKGIGRVIVIAGSAGNSRDLNSAFVSFQRARNIARLMNDMGLRTRVQMDSNRPPGAVDIIAAPRTGNRDA